MLMKKCIHAIYRINFFIQTSPTPKLKKAIPLLKLQHVSLKYYQLIIKNQ